MQNNFVYSNIVLIFVYRYKPNDTNIMKQVLIVLLLIAFIAFGFYLNQHTPNEAGYQTVSLTIK